MSFPVPDTAIGGSSYKDFGGAGPGIFSGSSKDSGKSKNKFRDALIAASKYKDQTDYKARKEAQEKEKAQTATMKISDDISVMEGYRDPGFTIEGQKGSGFLGPIGAAVGVFNPAVGAGISLAGNLTGY